MCYARVFTKARWGQQRDHTDIGVVFPRRGKARCVSRASVDLAARWQSSAASGATRTDAHRFVWRDEGTPTPPQRHVDTEAAQSSADSACEAGARAELVLKADKHDAPTFALENDRLGTVEDCPTPQVSQLVVAERG